MLDIDLLRKEFEAVELALLRRGDRDLVDSLKKIQEVDKQWRTAAAGAESVRAQINQINKSMQEILVAGGKIDEDLRIKSKLLGDRLVIYEAEESGLKDELYELLSSIPNIPDESVPDGLGACDNKLIRSFGTIEEKVHEILPHYALGAINEELETEQTINMSGSRFVSLFGSLAKLERALASYMIDNAEAHGFKLVSPPIIVKDSAMYGVGQLPKFAEDSFSVGKDGMRLIPTAEVPLTNFVAKKNLDYDSLPIRYVAVTPCFRSEAGSAGRDLKGLIRLHQFYKVELVSVVVQENSNEELEMMLSVAEKVLIGLNLPYRTMLLCVGDIGFSSSKTYDIEVWMAAQNKYVEISSCSNCKDFQARRLSAKYRDKETGKKLHVHTLNGSALAIGRTIAAIMEYYQNDDKTVSIPSALWPYMGEIKML